MKTAKQIFPALVSLIIAASLQACVSGKQLSTASANPQDLQGSYTLLLYGCHHPNDVKNLAILVSESSKYPLEIYDIPTSYKVEKGVSPQQALSEANTFLASCTMHKLWQTQLRRIPDDSGGTVGYEMRALYFPLEFGQTDVLLVNYALKDGIVKAYIKLDPNVERALQASGGNRNSGSK